MNGQDQPRADVLIAEARRWRAGTSNDEAFEIVDRLADALEAATGGDHIDAKHWGMVCRLRVQVKRLEAERDALVAENARLKAGNKALAEQMHENSAARNEARAERDTLAAALAAVREARSNHPECDVHPKGDPVSCGWKGVVLDIDAALSADPSEVLRSRDEKTWDEGHAAALHSVAWPKERQPNPYRRAQEGDGSLAEGLRQSAAGEVVSLGSFAQFAVDDEFAPGECDGSGTCPAPVHVHGCFTPHRASECDSPDEYGHITEEGASDER